MGRPFKQDGLNYKDVRGKIRLYDGLDLKRTSKFTRRSQLREIMRTWTNDVKKLKGYFHFIISFDEPKK